MRTVHVALIGLLLAVAVVPVAEEPWELWEERMVGPEPLEMVFVARLPSSAGPRSAATAPAR